MGEGSKLDPLFHQSVRTRLALLLYTSEPSFTQLKSSLSVTDGNLDAHLRRFSRAGYLHSRMILQRRPHTVYQLSESGRHAFEGYVRSLRDIVSATDDFANKSR